MLKRCIIAENRKLHASPIWVIFFVLPLISAGYGTFNYLQNLEILTERWYSLWTQHTLFYSMLFFPAMVAAYAAYLWRLEHLGHNWNFIMATPVHPLALFAAKFVVVGKLALLTHAFVFVLYAFCGKVFARLPGTPQGELLGGAVTAFCLPVGTFLLTSLVCLGAARISPWLGLAVQMFWCGQALAARGLAQESTNVYNELVRNDLPAARKAVSRIVGRDTQNLTAEGVTKAAVETVAENASDGVIAPLLYMLIGGAPLALTYKAINTMDSMLGYKNQKYLYFGRAAARLDDAANYLPSRLAGLLWVAAAALTGSSARGAWKIWRRDRRNHASPNSAQTESACAGALGVQLAGPAYYFGEYYDKPTIGDALRPVEPKDILRADRMMYAESLLALVLGIALRLLVLAM